MRHQVDKAKLGKNTSHRKAMVRNMVTSLILHERIETTLPKAKHVRRKAERLVTLGKQGTLHARRQAAKVLFDTKAVQKLFDGGLAERFKSRKGGYTRIYKLGNRRGDAAPMAILEYIDRPKSATKLDKPDSKLKTALKKARGEEVAVEPKKAKLAAKKASSKPSSAKEKASKSSAGKKGILSRLRGRSKKSS